jgi:hypothetical protein
VHFTETSFAKKTQQKITIVQNLMVVEPKRHSLLNMVEGFGGLGSLGEK